MIEKFEDFLKYIGMSAKSFEEFAYITKKKIILSNQCKGTKNISFLLEMIYFVFIGIRCKP
jgi:hypothetical protein